MIVVREIDDVRRKKREGEEVLEPIRSKRAHGTPRGMRDDHLFSHFLPSSSSSFSSSLAYIVMSALWTFPICLFAVWSEVHRQMDIDCFCHAAFLSVSSFFTVVALAHFSLGFLRMFCCPSFSFACLSFFSFFQVLQTLARNPRTPLSVVRDFILQYLQQETEKLTF